MFQTRRLIKFKYRATLKVSFFLPSMWKFLAPPTMLRAKCGLGLWIEKSTEKRKNEKLKKKLLKNSGESDDCTVEVPSVRRESPSHCS